MAEKFAALAELGPLTTRMKDLYDLWGIARREAFDAAVLARALSNAFAARATPGEGIDLALSDAFARDLVLAERWRAYLRRTGLVAPTDLADVLGTVRAFLAPVVMGEARGKWRPEVGGWTEHPT